MELMWFLKTLQELVDADIFYELVKISKVSFKILDGDKSGKKLMTCCHVQKCIF